MGQFYYSAKAFDVLERLDPNPEYWEGKRGACIGLFQQIIAGHEPRSAEFHKHRHFVPDNGGGEMDTFFISFKVFKTLMIHSSTQNRIL